MKKVLSLLLLFSIFLSFMPTSTKAATLADYRKMLEQYKKELADSQAAINKTESEIKETNKEIKRLKEEMISMSGELAVLKDDIIKYEEEIASKEVETKKLIEYLQLSGGENAYLEYAFNADDMTDLIYRMAVVEQITNYNEDIVKELKDLVKKNEDRQKKINEREKEIHKKEEELADLIVSLGEDKSILTESGVSANKQIKIYEDQIKMYEDLDCGENDVIGKDCAVLGSIGNWRKPTATGYITSEYGMRKLSSQKTATLHRGVDIGSKNPYKTKIYSIGNGRISKIYDDDYGALCVITEHYDSKEKKYYTATYCHLSSYNPKIKKGMKVTSDTWLGYMGATGWCEGPHLHFEIIDCRKLDLDDNNCGKWNNYVKYAEKRYNEGFKGPREFIKFPKRYSQWTSR